MSPRCSCVCDVPAAHSLAARLMCKAEDVLCNDELVEDFTSSKQALSMFAFKQLEPITVKGYPEPVTICEHGRRDAKSHPS
jgi:class 3 adenylate cyclase